MRRAVSLILSLLFATALGAAQAAPKADRPVRVGVFNGNGVSGVCLTEALEALRIDRDIRPEQVSAADVASGALDRLDVVVFPGGGGGRQMTDLGDVGAAKVRAFVLEKGRGAVGLCAGAYLLSDTPDYRCLRLCPAKALDREHDERGHGLIAYKVTPEGLSFFPELKGWQDTRVYYYEGPILEPSSSGPPGYTVLATMEGDVHLENDAPAGMTPGRPLLLTAEPGKGRVFLSVGHPEATPGLRWMVARAVRWAARRDAVEYTADVVRPGLLGSDVLFDKALRDEEASLHGKLMTGSPEERRAAIRRLAAIRSWDAGPWIRGLLRDGDAGVRITASRALVELEWTAGVADLEGAVAAETDAVVRADLALSLARLRAMAPSVAQRGGPGGRRVVALTMDDLPLVNAGTDDTAARLALVRRLAGAIRSHRLPFTAFVVGKNSQSPAGDEMLKIWLDAGVRLGNHTGTHTSLHQMGLEAYEKDVLAEDGPLRALLATKGLVPGYFRHPMLQNGRTQELKRDLSAFLAENGYAVAPVTIDNSEWIFAHAYSVALLKGDKASAERVRAAYLPYMASKFDYWERQSKQLLGYEVRQIFLFHANALNADCMEALVAMMRRRGYSFISLDEALRDPAYALPDGYLGGGGISWLHRWAIALGGKAALLAGEPTCPKWVMDLAGVDSE